MTRQDLIATRKALKDSLKNDSKAKSVALLKKAGILDKNGLVKGTKKTAA